MQQMHSCPNCGSRVAFGSRLCTNCGTQLNWPTQPQQQPQPPPQYQQPQQPGQWGGYQQQSGGWGKKIMVGLIIAVVFALVVCLVPLKEVPYAVTVDCQDTETYYEDEPYEVMEICYEPLEYQYLGWGFGGGPHYKLMNREEVAGHFTVRLVLYTIGKDKYLDLVWEYPQGFPEEVIESNFQKSVIEEILYLKPKEKGEVQWSWEELGVDPAETEYDGRWEVLPEEVRSEKTVIRYKQVEKERTVAKQRPETHYKKVTLLDYMLRYQ